MRRIGSRTLLAVGLSALTAILLFMGPEKIVNAASGDGKGEIFSNKTISVIVGSPPGGGVDFTARLFARFAGKHFPGKPRFIVRNIPGSGQLRGLQFAMRAKPDGLTVASLHTRWAVRSILGQDLGPFDVRTARIVGSPVAIARSGLLCVDRNVATSWKEILQSGKGMTVGGSERGGWRELGASLVELLGGPIKIVYGYGGTAESAAAFHRGEVIGVACQEDTVPRLFPEWLEQKRLVPLFWWGAPPGPAYLKRMGAKENPVHVLDLPGMDFTEESKIALQVADRMFLFNRAFVLRPGIPEDIHQAWVRSYEATIQDPGLVEVASKGGIEIGLGRAENFREALALSGKLSPSGLELFKKLMGQQEE